MAKARELSKSEALFQTPFFENIVRPLTFGLYRLLVTTVESLSPRHAYFLARALGCLGWIIGKKVRETSIRNIELAFGDSISDQRVREIGRRSLQHFLCTLFDVYLLPPFYKSGQWEGLFEVSDNQIEQFKRLSEHKGGVAFQSAHFGSWEAAAGLGTMHGKPLTMVYRPLVHPEIDQDFARARASIGSKPVVKEGALRAIYQTLRADGWIAILSDQNAGRSAAFLNFFGHAVSAQIEHLVAYRRFGTRIATGFMVREGFDFKFRYIGMWEEVFDPEADPEEESMRLGQWYLDLVEKMARDHPEQYLWLHRRYASRPHGTPGLYNNLGTKVLAKHLDQQPEAPITAKG